MVKKFKIQWWHILGALIIVVLLMKTMEPRELVTEGKQLMKPLFYDKNKNLISAMLPIFSTVVYAYQEYYDVYYLGFQITAVNTGDIELYDVYITDKAGLQPSPSPFSTALGCQGLINDKKIISIGGSTMWLLNDTGCIMDTLQFDGTTQTFKVNIMYNWTDEAGINHTGLKEGSASLQFIASMAATMEVSLDPGLTGGTPTLVIFRTSDLTYYTNSWIAYDIDGDGALDGFGGSIDYRSSSSTCTATRGAPLLTLIGGWEGGYGSVQPPKLYYVDATTLWVCEDELDGVGYSYVIYSTADSAACLDEVICLSESPVVGYETREIYG